MSEELTPRARHESRICVDIGVFEPETRCFTRTVSRHSIWLEEGPRLSEGEMVWLHIHLPEGPVLEATATVRRAAMGAKDVALEFSMFLRGGHRAWEAFLTGLARGEAPNPAERREWPRHEGVRFIVRAGDQEWESANHSLGGLFVASKVLLPEGEIVELALIHPESRETMVLSATVVRLQPGTEEKPRGMGLRFAEMTQREREALATFMTTQAQQTEAPPD
ncbi:MAG: PilZ domain-containing protein [Alphaproteobacteria bacterium]|nr:PilZ domain-containing protein [Alphaproteobacteria bacterium]MCB9791428.1 PilZ domain-containing protein [Alphaproteobacteria bacterium]